MMLHRHFESRKPRPKKGMDVKEGEDMMPDEERHPEPKEPPKRRKRKTE